MRSIALVVVAIVILGSVASIVFVENASAKSSIVTLSDPSPPRTLQQIKSEAYALEAQVKSVAGRKTNPILDGTGGTQIARSIVHTPTNGFPSGQFNATSIVSNSYVQITNVSGDAFDNSFIERFWTIKDPDSVFSETDTWLENAKQNSNQEVYMYLNRPMPDGFNATISLYTNTGVTSRDVCTFVTSGEPSDNSSIQSMLKVRACVRTLNGLTNEYRFVYVDGAGTEHFWDGASWTLVETPFLAGANANHMNPVSIKRDVGSSEYRFVLNDVGVGFTYYVATIAFASVRDGATLNDWWGFGDPYLVAWDDVYPHVTTMRFRINDFTLVPTSSPTSGTFTSVVMPTSEWDGLLVKETLVQYGSVTIDVRHANNSDMSGASAYATITNNTDESALNLRAGFFQYRLTFTTTGQKLFVSTFNYKSRGFGSSPSKDIDTTIDRMTLWSHFNWTVPLNRAINFVSTSASDINFYVNNSFLDFQSVTSRNAAIRWNSVIAQAGIYHMNLYVTNSTIARFGNFSYWIQPSSGLPSLFSFVTLANVSASTFNNILILSNLDGASRFSVREMDVFDSNLTHYNFVNADYNAGQNVRTFVRNICTSVPEQHTGVCAQAGLGQSTRIVVQWNWMRFGFNQFAWVGSKIGNGTSSELINVSYNYVEHSVHTAIGLYSQTVGLFGDSLSRGYYSTVYRNYINESRYIQIQLNGNTSYTRIIGNYIQGQAGNFSEAIGAHNRINNLVIDSNAVWNMNTTNNRGIVVVGFDWNVTISRNVIYDVGVRQIDIESLGLKFFNATHVEKSDYTWRGMNITVRDNYMNGSWKGEQAYFQDSGYVLAYNNTIVNVPSAGGIGLTDGWGVEQSGPWVDWHNGFASFSSIQFVVNPSREHDVWLRYFRASRIFVDAIDNNAHMLFVKSLSSKWNLTYDVSTQSSCALIFEWTGRACDPTHDVPNNYTYHGASSKYAWIPSKWFNKTSTIDMHPFVRLEVNVPSGLSAFVVDTTTGEDVPFTSGSIIWSITPTHDYRVTFEIAILRLVTRIIIPVFIIALLMIFLVALITIILGATQRRKYE